MNSNIETQHKQRSKLIEVNFQMPAVLNLAHTDQWLTSFLDVDAAELHNITCIVASGSPPELTGRT